EREAGPAVHREGGWVREEEEPRPLRVQDKVSNRSPGRRTPSSAGAPGDPGDGGRTDARGGAARRPRLRRTSRAAGGAGAYLLALPPCSSPPRLPMNAPDAMLQHLADLGLKRQQTVYYNLPPARL